jgi:arabinofuranosyltransferase
MPGRRFLIALGGAFFLVVLIRTAWLSELSYLTLRTIEHAATGHGLRWNVTERVQVFDHPLWLLLLLAGRIVTGESYFTTFVISLALSAATAVLVLRSAPRSEGIVLGAVLLSSSWAIVTYSTSGLEGPLAHLLVVAFCLAWLARPQTPQRVRALAGLAGLAALTHPATLLITGPVVIAASRRDLPGTTDVGPYADTDTGARNQRRVGSWTTAALAGGPLLAWGVFAAFYYGTAVPMPVIAEWTERASLATFLQGAARMFAFVLRHDPLTLGTIITAVVLARRTASVTRPLAWGMVAYTVILALWAGDGMPGRWLALPCLVATLIIVRHPATDGGRVFSASIAAAIALAAVPALAPMQSDARFGTFSQVTNTRDPRATDYPATGLLLDIRQWYPPHHPEATRGGLAWKDTNRVKTSPHPAFFGFAAGYGVHVIDLTGRTDPLLGRLRPAHAAVFPAGAHRRVPDGYEASLREKGNRIGDPVLAAYYDRVRFVTRGPLGDPRRLVAALRLAFESPPQPAALMSRRSNPGP